MFLADLMRAIELPVESHFMALTRYGGAEESRGALRILLDVDVDLSGRDVLLVEDIFDTGLTLSYLLSVLGVAWPRVARGRDTAGQVGAPHRAAGASLRRVRLPRSIRGRLRARLQRSATGTCPTSSQVDDLEALKADPDALVPSAPRRCRRCEAVRVARPGARGYPRWTMIEMELTGVRVELPDESTHRLAARARG